MTDYVTRIRNLRQNSPLQWACLIGLRVNEWRTISHLLRDIAGFDNEEQVPRALYRLRQSNLIYIKCINGRDNVYSAKPAVREAVEAVLSEI